MAACRTRACWSCSLKQGPGRSFVPEFLSARWGEEGQGEATGLHRLEHWYRRSVFAWNELQFHRLADFELVEVAIDDVGHHRWALGQGDVGDRVGHLGTCHHAERVDLALAGCFHPLAVTEAERTERARIPVRLLARRAAADQELARRAAVKIGLGLRVGIGRADEGNLALNKGHVDHSRSRMTVLPKCRVPSEPPVPCAIARSQFFTCSFGCASPRN